MSTTFKRAVASICAVSMLTLSPGASADWVNDFFNDAGNASNTTHGGAFHGQTMNMYTGGSAFIRSPVRNYQLVNFTPPSITAGCGGIDGFAGAFSFINKDQFVKMLKNIGSNAKGYLFMIALKGLAPEIAEIMQYLQKVSQDINNFSINSCDAAKRLVDSAGEKLDSVKGRQAANWALALNRDEDALASYTRTRGNRSEIQMQMADAKANLAGVRPTSGTASPAILEGNVVWRALNMDATGFQEIELRMLMSLIGTVVVDESGSAPIYRVQGATLKLQDILGSNVAARASSKIKLIKCTDGYGAGQCYDMTTEDVDSSSFKQLIVQRLTQIQSAMQGRISQSPSNIDFTAFTSLPIQRMLATGTTVRSPGIASAIIDKYTDVAAVEYAATFVRYALDILEQTLRQAKSNKSAMEGQEIERFEKRMQEVKTEVMAELRTAYSQGQYLLNLNQDLEHMERTMRVSFSQQTAAALSFGRR
jgi:conjugative transfer pilus assembly protein TraH